MHETPAPQDPGRDENPSGMPSGPGMPPGPPGPGVPAGPGAYPELGSPHWRLVPQTPDWDEAYLAAPADDDEYPGDPDEYQDPDNAPPPGLDDAELDALLAAAGEVTAERAQAAEQAARLGHTAALAAMSAVSAGRRGPGMPGSADTVPGEDPSPAAGFGSGQPLDVAAGCATLGSFLETAAGDDDRYTGASDDELAGVICAADRVEANASAVKHAAIAELVRRRPAPDAAVAGPAQMPEQCHEFTGRELGAILGVSPGDAEEMLDLARLLEVSLPGTKAAFRAGILSRDKAAIIAWATALLDPEEARKAEAMVLGRAGSLTRHGLRAAINHAVMAVNPDKARKRREHAAKLTRVERWSELSGNAGLAGRELPPAKVLAADQRVTAWAKELRKAGLDGTMDQLRAKAFLDLLLGTDSRPLGSHPDSKYDPDGAPDPDGAAEPWTPAPPGPVAGLIPPGFAGHVNLTIPATTILDLADRPAEMPGIGPIDPDLARDLAESAARNPRSTWCVTVTDSQGHAIGHGCARPAPAGRQKRPKPGAPRGPDPPSRARFTFTPPARPVRPEVTGPGGSPPGSPASGTCSWTSSRSPPNTVITATRPRVMIPASSSAT